MKCTIESTFNSIFVKYKIYSASHRENILLSWSHQEPLVQKHLSFWHLTSFYHTLISPSKTNLIQGVFSVFYSRRLSARAL